MFWFQLKLLSVVLFCCIRGSPVILVIIQDHLVEYFCRKIPSVDLKPAQVSPLCHWQLHNRNEIQFYTPRAQREKNVNGMKKKSFYELFVPKERGSDFYQCDSFKERSCTTDSSFNLPETFYLGRGYCSAVLCRVSCTALSHCQLVYLDTQMKCWIREVQSDAASGYCPSSGHIKGLVSRHASADLLFGFHHYKTDDFFSNEIQ